MPTPAGPRRRSKVRTGTLVAAGHLVVERRIALRLTQAELADLAGSSLSSVRRLEAGHDTVTLTVLLAVLDALGLALAAGPLPELNTLPGAVVLKAQPSPPTDVAR